MTASIASIAAILVVGFVGSSRAVAAGPAPAAAPTGAFSTSMLFGESPSSMAPAAASGPAGSGDPAIASNQISTSAPNPARQPIPLRAYWDNGLHLESDNKQFQLHFGGIGMLDSVFIISPQSIIAGPKNSSNGVGNAQATQLRRAVLQVDGAIFDQFDYIIQYDFANASNDNSGLQPSSFSNLTSSPAPLNIWMQVRDLPLLGNVRIGNQDKPIGMENNSSAAFLPFMERSDNHDAFYGPFDNGFALGIASWNWSESERLTWRYGVYQPATNVFGVALNKYSVGGRITGLPWYEDEGRQLVHLGLGYWGGELVEDESRDRARPLLRNAPGFAVPVLADTSEFPGNKQFTLAPELAMVLGSLTIQAEYAGQWVTDAIAPNGQNQGTVFFHGGYVEALYFLTGEYQAYLRRAGVFGRVVPLHDYHWNKHEDCQGCGAWQIGARFGYLNLNDKGIQGGQLYDVTLGLNWYLNPCMKLQCNCMAQHRDMPAVAPGWINGVGVRAVYDF